jgi:hypothetical protein
MYSLYWIKYPHYTNPYSEGYIGISVRPNERFIEHKKYNSKNLHLSRCIEKGASMEILLKNLSYEEALNLEEQYRPVINTGWNINRGGNIPPSRKGIKYKEGNQILIGEDRTQKQKEASEKHSEKMKGRKSWNDGMKGTPGPCKSCIYKGIEFTSRKEAAEYFNVSISAVSQWIKKNVKLSCLQEE